MNRPLKIFFSCSGVGILNRGIESFFREAFDGLRGTEGLDITLYKGAGEPKSDERVLWNLPRTGRVSQLLGRCIRRNGYVVEQLSTFPSMVRAIRRERPDVIFYSDSNLGFQLFRWRQRIGVPFRLLYSNGGPCRPPFERRDYVHQVAPLYLEEALAGGEPPEKHFMIPYGIQVPDGAPISDLAVKRTLCQKLGLPLDRKIVLSVGWIARAHKRMDYVIEEVARMAEPRPFLQLLGAMDDASPEIVALGNRLLGPDNFSASSVPYEQVADYYGAADCFVLGSLKEGFGRVYLEALMHGLPTIGHRHPVIEYVLGDAGITADLTQPGNLASLLTKVLSDLCPPSSDLSSALLSSAPGSALRASPSALAAQRRESVRTRFSWPVLAPQYRDMFQATAARPLVQA